MDAPQTSKILSPPKRKKWSIWTLLISLLIGWATRHSTRYPVVRIPCEAWTSPQNAKGYHRFVGMIDEDRQEAIVISNRVQLPTAPVEERRVEISAHSLVNGLEKHRLTPKLVGSFRYASRVGNKLVLGSGASNNDAPVAACIDLATEKVDWQLARKSIATRIDYVHLSPCGSYLVHLAAGKISSQDRTWLIDTRTGNPIAQLKRSAPNARVYWTDNDRFFCIVSRDDDDNRGPNPRLEVQGYDSQTGKPVRGTSTVSLATKNYRFGQVPLEINWPMPDSVSIPIAYDHPLATPPTPFPINRLPQSRPTRFANVKIDPEQGLKVSENATTDSQLSLGDRMRAGREFHGGWIEVRYENPFLKLIAATDRVIKPIGLFDHWQKLTKQLRSPHMYVIETRQSVDDPLPLTRAVFAEGPVLEHVWSKSQRFVAGRRGSIFEKHELLVYALDPLMPTWLWQMLVTGSVFITCCLLRWSTNKVVSRFTRKQE